MKKEALQKKLIKKNEPFSTKTQINSFWNLINKTQINSIFNNLIK